MADELSASGMLMEPQVFRKVFTKALSDTNFRRQISREGFRALEREGFKTQGIPKDVQDMLMKAANIPSARPKCGVCGICGACGLCGEIDLGSASAALWALFGLALTSQTPAKP